MARNQLTHLSGTTQRLVRAARTQTGFTLIELLMVVTLSVILMLGASALFMTFLISNTKVTGQQKLKNDGEYALRQMEFLLRNAIQLVPDPNDAACANSTSPSCICYSDMSQISLKSRDGGVTTLSTVSDSSDENTSKIASTSGVLNSSFFLTSGSVNLSSLEFDCTMATDGSAPFVEIGFALSTPAADGETVTQEFHTEVTLRNM